jgi:hypothetical protein
MVKIGNLSKEIVDAFNLNYEEGTEIKLTRGRKRHMSKHREEFADFDATFDSIDEIIASPDYVGLHPNGDSLQYIKRMDGNVLVAVRLGDNLTVRTMYVITENKLRNYIEADRIKRM